MGTASGSPTGPRPCATDPFPGRAWPAIADPVDDYEDVKEWAGDWWEAMPWWKWWALDRWLETQPHIRKLIWIDDDLRDFRDDDDATGGARRAWTIDTALRHGTHVNPILMAPDKAQGLRPLDLQIIREELHGYM